MPFSNRSLNGVLSGSIRRFQNGDWSRYSIRLVFATISANQRRLMFIVSASMPY